MNAEALITARPSNLPEKDNRPQCFTDTTSMMDGLWTSEAKTLPVIKDHRDLLAETLVSVQLYGMTDFQAWFRSAACRQ